MKAALTRGQKSTKTGILSSFRRSSIHLRGKWEPMAFGVIDTKPGV